MTQEGAGLVTRGLEFHPHNPGTKKARHGSMVCSSSMERWRQTNLCLIGQPVYCYRPVRLCVKKQGRSLTSAAVLQRPHQSGILRYGTASCHQTLLNSRTFLETPMDGVRFFPKLYQLYVTEEEAERLPPPTDGSRCRDL